MPRTVFISYRRDALGRSFARSVAGELNQRGYQVFLDVDTMDPGKWAAQILVEVPRRTHFLLLLTPGALDRCTDENDWVRREFLLAALHQRNIVPVCEESCDLGKLRQNCDAAVRAIFDYQGITLRQAHWAGGIDELVNRYIPPEIVHRQIPAATPSRPHFDLSRILDAAPAELIGRDAELKQLRQAWKAAKDGKAKKPNVITIVAWGGVGKSSLVGHWATKLLADAAAGCEAAFGWSFYSQGTRDQGSASGDLFLDEALRFFGEAAFAGSAASGHEKGSRLARLIQARRTLLVLDGLEPLQHPPGPLAGELKDPGVKTLLRQLAQSNPGLCVVTTRERVADLQAFRETTAPEWPLARLSVPAGVALLKSLKVHGPERDFETLVEQVRGHALTLQLAGNFLRDAHEGDIRKRDLFAFSEADAEVQGGHAFRAIAAYERWLDPKIGWWQRIRLWFSRKERQRRNSDRVLIAVLRLQGLFDRPVRPELLKALRQPPAIPQLTEPLATLTDAQWNLAVSRLRDCDLLAWSDSQPSTLNSPPSLDAHPLIREYFAHQLRTQHPNAYRAAHRRLYEHLCATTKEGDEPTLAELEPLYQAVWHGCQAGLQQEACDKVYGDRINKGTEFYSTKKLGAFGADLGAVACFFDVRWSQVSPALSAADQAWLLSQAAFLLRALGRLREAVEPMRVTLDINVKDSKWTNAAAVASNLSELSLTLGEVADGVTFGRQSVDYADRSGDAFHRMSKRATHADALHQSGEPAAARPLFEEAERLHREDQREYPLLYSLQGFKYCDLLLAPAEQAAAQHPGCSEAARVLPHDGPTAEQTSLLHDVEQRATQTLEWVTTQRWLLDIALDQLTLARIVLYRGLLTGDPLPSPDDRHSHIAQALAGLRQAGATHHVPRGLLTSAWTRHARGDAAGAQADLDEAWEIAERGPMPLFMADVLLYRVRLFGGRQAEGGKRKDEYPWGSVAEDLAEAQWLIESCGYGRRLAELEAAERALSAYTSSHVRAALQDGGHLFTHEQIRTLAANWSVTNRRRCELIDKRIRNAISSEEQTELERLQAFADYYLSREAPESTTALESLERLIASSDTDVRNNK